MKKYLLLLFILFLVGCESNTETEVDLVGSTAPVLETVEEVTFKLKAPEQDWLGEEYVLEVSDDTAVSSLTVIEDNVNFEEIGEYKVVIEAVDEDGMKTTNTIVVNVIDGVAPFIKDRTSFPDVIGLGNRIPDWNEYISVIDAYDGDVTITDEMISTNLDTSKPGDYQITINAFDSSGNTSSKTFDIRVEKTYTITLDDVEVIHSLDGYIITAYTNPKKFNIEIPSEFDGVPVVEIFGGAFTSEKIRTLVLNEGLKKIGNEAFKDNFISSLMVPSTVEFIGNDAFTKNDLFELNMSTSVELGESVFNDNYIEVLNGQESNGLIYNNDQSTILSYGGASDVINFIPSTVKRIENYAFLKTGLIEVIVPETVEYVGEMAFATNEIVSLHLSTSTALGSSAFVGSEIATLNGSSFDGFVYDRSEGVENRTLINSYVGENKEVTIPEGVVEIGPSAFYSAGLKSLVIPASVMEVGSNAFRGNKDLESLVVEGENPERLGVGLVGYGFDDIIPFDISSIESDGKSLIVFVSFDNYRDYELGVPFDTFYSFYKGDLSLEGYLEDISYSQYKLDVEFLSDNYAFYYDPQPMEYYLRKTADNPIGYETEAEEDARFKQLFVGMVNWIDSEGFIEDGRRLDANNDNMIDNIMIFHLGRGGWSDLLWPKQGGYSGPRLTIAGKTVNEFITLSLGNPDEASAPSSLSTYAHEYLHLLGAADYYQYGGDYVNSIAPWEIMASGGQLKHPLQFLKHEYLGIDVDMTETATGGTFTLNNTLNPENNFIHIDLGHLNESIYIEYRSQDSEYEAQIPDSGVLVYRVNTRYFGNTRGVYNTSMENMEEIHIFKPSTYDPTYLSQGKYIIEADSGYARYAYDTSEAAMNMSTYQEMGKGTDVKMYYADGTEMNIRITLDDMNSKTATITVEFID